ncbi:MAG: hypothetical protein HQL30_11875 [Candidatus Omnitrophica bacterium]|nr:hypothetical protein [Candidatus Omnitrophota bacterium]
MKTFFMKIFLVVASMFCLFEGLVLAAVGLGRLAPERLLSIYNRVIAIPNSLTTIFSVGMFFLILGFILLLVASRTRPQPKMILVEKEGRVLGIPQATVKDYVVQILKKNPYMTDTTVTFEPAKKGWIDITIVSGFSGVSSVHKELSRVEETLRSEIENVFDWKDFKFIFELRGVGVDPRKKYFAAEKAAVEASKQKAVIEAPGEEGAEEDEGAETDDLTDTMDGTPQEAEASEGFSRPDEEGEIEPEPDDESVPEEEEIRMKPGPKQKHRPKAKNKARTRTDAKDTSILSRLLWGK